jgi:hypothetical protein
MRRKEISQFQFRISLHTSFTKGRNPSMYLPPITNQWDLAITGCGKSPHGLATRVTSCVIETAGPSNVAGHRFWPYWAISRRNPVRARNVFFLM